MNYYNEHDKKAAAWLVELIKQGHIAPGIVDERSINDVQPGDLAGFTQCHFFAGIGVWSYALRRAGWPDDRPVWTGSCPCQPFSNAGGRAGFADERHLWPNWFQLIAQCRPPVVFGEQVASKDGLAWFDLVHADLEAARYAVGAADLCAAGVGAPHIRQRLWFVGVADAQRPGLQVRADGDVRGTVGHDEGRHAVESGHGGVRVVGDAASGGRGEFGHAMGAGRSGHADGAGLAGIVANDNDPGLGWQQGLRIRGSDVLHVDGRSPVSGAWAGADWIFCRDQKFRPVEPGTFPLVNGAPERVGLLRGYGNAIVAEVAETFIAAYLDVEGGGLTL